jgi:hypothetical protein
MTDTLDALMETAARLGIRLWVERDRLRYQAPRGVLTDELRQRLRQHKYEIIDRLSGWEFMQRQLAAEGLQLVHPDRWLAFRERR